MGGLDKIKFQMSEQLIMELLYEYVKFNSICQ